MDYASMNKAALRNACKDARISYGGMNLEQMRAALQAHADQLAAERAADEAALADRTSYLAGLGKYGEGEEGAAVCPHCGIDHTDNGFTTPDDVGANDKQDRTLHQLGQQHAEFACMGCGGEWGPVREPYVAPTKQRKPKPETTGLKIQKDRVERNGIKQPSLGGLCRAVWDACADMQALQDTPLAVKQVKEHAATVGWNVNNAVIEFYRWKKWAAPTAEEQLAAHEEARNAEAEEQLAATPAPAEA